MRKFYLSSFLLVFFKVYLIAAVGLFGSQNITLNGTNYNSNTNLGAFSPNMLRLNGGWGNTFQNGGDDACHIILEYSVSPGGPSSSIILNFVSQNPGAGSNIDKFHQTTGLDINLSSLGTGSYTLNVNYKIYGRFGGVSCGTPGTANEFTTATLASQTFQFSITPLPVEYTEFSVKGSKGGNILQWTTASETNNEYFEVQHSTDGRQFEAVGQVKGYGNSNTERDYYFSHEVSGTAISYYRLKQVDFDGKYEYSGIISVRSENDRWDESIAVSPNPVADFLLVTGISEQADYMITDYSGRQLMTGSVVSGQGLDVSTLSSGFYTLILQEGAQKSAHKWIKK